MSIEPGPSQIISDVDFLLRQIDQALRNKDLARAESLLQSAQERIPEGAPQRAELQNKVREVRALRTTRVSDLEDVVRKAMASSPIDFDQAETTLNDLERFEPGNPFLAGWRNTLAEKRREQRQEIHVKEIEAELNHRWEEAEKAEQAGLHGTPLIKLYEAALEYAAKEAANLDVPRTRGLEQQAKDRYVRIRQVHKEATTRQTTGQYKALLEQLGQMDPSAKVPISRDLYNLEESLDYMPAGEAIKLLQVQARDYAAQKATGYRDKALRYLDEQAPTAAEKELLTALELFALDEEEKRKTDKIMSDMVRPAVEKRKEATAKAQAAEKHGDPVQAWRLFAEARTADPFAPDVQQMYDRLVKRVNDYLAGRLAEAQRALEGTGKPDWAYARRLAKEVRDLAERDSAFQPHLSTADAILAQVDGWERVENEIKTAIADAEAKLSEDPRRAYEGLLARKAGWKEKAERYPELAQFLARLEARVNITDLLARLEQAIKDPTLTVVEGALKDCESALKQDVPRRGDLEAVQRRLRLHLAYLQGVTLLQNPDRSMTDEHTGLGSLQQVIDGKGDDREEAAKVAGTVKADRRAEEAANTALRQASQKLQDKDFEGAYRLLEPHRNRREVAGTFAAAAQGWEDQLVSLTADALDAVRIDEAKARKWIENLKTPLGSDQVAIFKPRVLGRCAAQRARDLTQQPGRKWQEVVAAWDEALQADPGNPEYQNERQGADKKRAFSELSTTSLEAPVHALEDLAETYPRDLEVKVWLIDAWLKYIGTLKRYDEIETQAQKAHALIVQAQRLAGATDAPKPIQRSLTEQAKTVEATLDIAQRCNDIEQQILPDKLLDAWRRAKAQAAELLAAYLQRQESLTRWWRRLSSTALAGAQERLTARQTEGADVWDKVHPAAQILILDPENVVARQQLQAVFQAIMVLEAKQNAAEHDIVGAGYSGDNRTALGCQLTEANDIRRKLILAEQVLLNFGGFFQNPDSLRDQVNKLRARNETLIEKLERLKQYVSNAEHAINQARSDGSDTAWYAFDEQRNLVNNLGYGKHRTVSALDELKRQVQKKQDYLRRLRTNLVQAASDGNIAEALRLAELIGGRSILADASASAQPGATDDPMADPNDEYGEHGQIHLREPYTGRPLAGLKPLVGMLQAQAHQIAQITAWLPIVPVAAAAGGNQQLKVIRPIVSWEQILPAVDDAMQSGTFDQARGIIDEVINGQDNGLYHGELALQRARELLDRPPVTEQDLNSREARRLWDFGRKLLTTVQADLEAARRRQADVDRLENDWQDSYRRFESAIEAVTDELRRPFIQRIGRGAELAELKVQARAAYMACEQLCPRHPDLAGWADNEMLR